MSIRVGLIRPIYPMWPLLGLFCDIAGPTAEMAWLSESPTSGHAHRVRSASISRPIRNSSAPAPHGRRWRADMALFSCLLRPLEPFWSLRSSSSSRRMAKPPSPHYVSPWNDPINGAFFNRLLRFFPEICKLIFVFDVRLAEQIVGPANEQIVYYLLYFGEYLSNSFVVD